MIADKLKRDRITASVTGQPADAQDEGYDTHKQLEKVDKKGHDREVDKKLTERI